MVNSIVDIIALSIPLVGMVVAIIVIYLEYKKKMAMIEKGLIPEEEKEKHNHSPGNKLAWGIAMFGIGISILTGWRFNFGEEFIAGSIFVSIGIGLLVAYFWKKRQNE